MTKSLLRLYRPRKKKPDVWVAYADPVGKLSSAIEEVGEIGPLFAEREVHTQATGTATEASLRKTRADCTILHFATHGFLNGVKPAETYLELAPDPPSDGKLMQMEIWPAFREVVPCVKKHNLRLVVLSACETARAANAPEAEVLGMPDKFAAVGSPAVVASLWSVYTWSTTDLMVEFYRRVAKEKQDTATALLEARRALLADRARGRYAHPYYWAPFLLFGDWR
jgi:CHAT domain-containing protein